MAYNLDSAADFAGGAFNVTPSDSADQDNQPFAVWATGTGNLKCKCADGSVVTVAVPSAGTILPFAVLRIYATGTSVTNANIIGMKIR